MGQNLLWLLFSHWLLTPEELSANTVIILRKIKPKIEKL